MKSRLLLALFVVTSALVASSLAMYHPPPTAQEWDFHCLQHWREDATECCSLSGAARQACWCLGLPLTVDVDVVPTWDNPPGEIVVGNVVDLQVMTNSTDVAGVLFVALRPDADPENPDSIFVIGQGDGEINDGDEVRWSISANTGKRPLDLGEERIVIWAESELLRNGARTTLQSSRPLRLDLE